MLKAVGDSWKNDLKNSLMVFCRLYMNSKLSNLTVGSTDNIKLLFKPLLDTEATYEPESYGSGRARWFKNLHIRLKEKG